MAATSTGTGAGGELVFFGGTDWSALGRSGGKMKKDAKDELAKEELYPNLSEPHRLKTLQGVQISFVAAGPAAVHCLACAADGRLFTWGRNEKGQLGHGDQIQRNTPTVVAALAGKIVTKGSGGRHHSAFVLQDGESFACGLNTHGQLGSGSVKKGKEDLVLAPVRALVTGCTHVACGIDFTMWLAGGKVYTAGCGQYGVLGDGDDHSYNAKDSSIQIQYEPVPTPKMVAALATQNIIKIAAGQQHCITVDDAGNCFTWGNGGYGRLGHKIQQDEAKPRRVEFFSNRMAVPKDLAVIAGGGTSSFCTGPGGQMYSWGKLKVSGDNQTYPNAVLDLSGWHVRDLACGPGTFAVAADSSVITWGAATNGELGYSSGKKSSANPGKCDALEGGVTHQVACGVGFTMALVDRAHSKLEKLPVFESKAPDAEAAPEEAPADKKGGKGAAGKRKAEPAAGKAKKAK